MKRILCLLLFVSLLATVQAEEVLLDEEVPFELSDALPDGLSLEGTEVSPSIDAETDTFDTEISILETESDILDTETGTSDTETGTLDTETDALMQNPKLFKFQRLNLIGEAQKCTSATKVLHCTPPQMLSMVRA